jgi:hypothetical protein
LLPHPLIAAARSGSSAAKVSDCDVLFDTTIAQATDLPARAGSDAFAGLDGQTAKPWSRYYGREYPAFNTF